MPRARANSSSQTPTTRYVLGNNETPNQPVSEFLAKEFIRLKKIANEPMDCPICLDAICCDRCVCVLLCGHYGHYMCLQKQSICPLCRS